MELRSVRCLVAVADAGTVTAGAASLGMGQPAVSRQLQQLERQLRVRLFDRDDGRLRLTAAGLQVLPHARALLQAAQDVAASAGDAAAGGLSRVELVCAGTTRDDILAPWLAVWSAQSPLPSVREASVDGIYPALARGADLAVAPIAPPPELASAAIAELALWACVAPSHPWARRGEVPLSELAQAELLLLERSFHARRRLDAALESAGLGARPVAEFGSPVIAQAVAATGRGICVLTDDPRFGLVPLRILADDGSAVSIRLHAAWNPAHHAAAALGELAQDLRRFTRQRYPALARETGQRAPGRMN